MSSDVLICQVCLRTDRTLKCIDEKLTDFKDELCKFTDKSSGHQYCWECECILKKLYNFRNKCLRADKILRRWKETSVTDRIPAAQIHTLLPQTKLDLWSPNNNKILALPYCQTESSNVKMGLSVSPLMPPLVIKAVVKPQPKTAADADMYKLMPKLAYLRRLPKTKVQNTDLVNIKPKPVYKIQTENLVKETDIGKVMPSLAYAQKPRSETVPEINMVTGSNMVTGTKLVTGKNSVTGTNIITGTKMVTGTNLVTGSNMVSGTMVRIMPNLVNISSQEATNMNLLSNIHFYRCDSTNINNNTIRPQSNMTINNNSQPTTNMANIIQNPITNMINMPRPTTNVNDNMTNMPRAMINTSNNLPRPMSDMNNTPRPMTNTNNNTPGAMTNMPRPMTNTNNISPKSLANINICIPNSTNVVELKPESVTKINMPVGGPILRVNLPVGSLNFKEPIVRPLIAETLKEETVKEDLQQSTSTIEIKLEPDNETDEAVQNLLGAEFDQFKESDLAETIVKTEDITIEYVDVNEAIETKKNSACKQKHDCDVAHCYEHRTPDDQLDDNGDDVSVNSNDIEHIDRELNVKDDNLSICSDDLEELNKMLDSDVELKENEESGNVNDDRLGFTSVDLDELNKILDDSCDEDILESRKKNLTELADITLSDDDVIMEAENVETVNISSSDESDVDIPDEDWSSYEKAVEKLKVMSNDTDEIYNVYNRIISEKKRSFMDILILSEPKNQKGCLSLIKMKRMNNDIERVVGNNEEVLERLVTVNKERFIASIAAKLESCGELKTAGTLINKQFVLDCLKDKVNDDLLTRVWKAVLNKKNKSSFTPRAMQLLKFIQNKYKQTEYENVFDIEYLNTKKEVIEEFNRRKENPSYIDAKFKCDTCHQWFINKDMMINHVKLHVIGPNDKFVCKICKLRFSDKRRLYTHERTHRIVYRCKKCPVVTHFHGSMVKHYHQHKGQPFKCEVCFKVISKVSCYYKHLANVHRRKFACVACGDGFYTEEKLKKHYCKQQGKPIDGAKSAKCHICKVVFASAKVKQKHIKMSHKLPARGDHKKISTNTDVVARTWLKSVKRKTITCQLNHTGGRRFKCRICSKAFRHRCTFNDHMKEVHNQRVKKKKNKKDNP